MTSMTDRGQLFIHYFLNTGPCGSLSVQESPSHDNIHSSSSNPSIDKFIKELKENYLEMDVLPDEDWPPSIGRHESNLVLIEHERDTLPGAKEAEAMLRDYVGGNVDKIRDKKKEIKYNEMFSFLKGKSNTKFRMLIDGAPGIGKTTLCRKFCKDWGSEAILQKFSVVWLLNLREERIAKAKAINDLFQHYNTKVQRELLQHIEETGGEGQLLVCDGFEELNKQEITQCSLFLDIIRGKVLPNCSVIVTSRPYASQMLQQMSRITHHVEIVGFTKEQIKECIRQNITSKPKAEELIEQLKQRLDILSLCYTPLNAVIMIYIYKQGDHTKHTLPTTLTQLYTLYIRHTLKRSVKIHFKNLDADDITDLKDLPDPIKVTYTALCEMAYNGLQKGQLEFDASQLPQSLQECPGCKSSKPDLLSLMSGSKGFKSSDVEVSYQFTHLTVQEFLAAWYAATTLKPKKQSDLFIEKAHDERFRMMVLFLAGITRLQDPEIYQKILQSIPLQHNIILPPNIPQYLLQLLKPVQLHPTTEEQLLQGCQLLQQVARESVPNQKLQLVQLLFSSAFFKKLLIPAQQQMLQSMVKQLQELFLQQDNPDQELLIQIMEGLSKEFFIVQPPEELQYLHVLQGLEKLNSIQQQQNVEFHSQHSTQLQETLQKWLYELLERCQKLPLIFQQILKVMQQYSLKPLQLPLLQQVEDMKQVVALKLALLPLNDNFFLIHLIYESQNFNLSQLLANAFQDEELNIYLHKYDLFQVTVFAHFLSTSNSPWKEVKLNSVNDQQMEILHQICCEHAGSSNVKRAQSIFFNETQKVRLHYQLDNTSPLPERTSFSYLHDMKVKSLSLLVFNASGNASSKYIPILFNVLSCQTTIQNLSLHLSSFAIGIEEWDALKELLTANSSLRYLKISDCFFAVELRVEHIATGLVHNHSLKELDISCNDITSVGAMSIANALESNTTLESLNISKNKLESTPNSPSLPKSSSNTSSLSPPLQLLAQPTPALSTTHSQPLSPSPTSHDGGVGAAMADMLSHNSTLTELNVSKCDLTPQSCVSMFKALKHNSSLKKLNISLNIFDQAASEAMVGMLSCNRALIELNVACCGLVPQSCVSMFKALEHNSSLKKLDISGTTFDQAASEALTDMLSTNTELKISVNPKH